MRYIINDDDLEDWIARLKKPELDQSELEYVIEEMENEVQSNITEIKRRIEQQKNQ